MLRDARSRSREGRELLLPRVRVLLPRFGVLWRGLLRERLVVLRVSGEGGKGF